MKKQNMKKKIAVLAVLATMSFASALSAQEIVLPVVAKPSILEEGTQRALTAEQIAELLPWAKDSKMFLVDLLDNIQTLSTADKIDRLIDGMKQVVGDSSPKNSQLFMRYALNRGIVLNTFIQEESDANAVGTSDVQLRVLRSSVVMAIKYYDTDMDILTKKTSAPYVLFGLDYFEFLSELNKSIFDASAQYKIQRTALEWFQWDLYRDLNSTSFAPQIVKINNSLKTFPDKAVTKKALTDAQSIAFIRQMKGIAAQLKNSGGINQVVERINTEKQNVLKAKEEKEKEAAEAKMEIGSVPRQQALETLLAQKPLLKTVADSIANIQKSMKYVSNVKDFFDAVAPGVSNPSEAYKEELKAIAFKNRSVLMNLPDVTVQDVWKLAKMTNNTDHIAIITTEFAPKVKSAADFLKLFTFVVDSPSDNYKEILQKLTTQNMNYFIALRPTESQKNELLGRFK